jgi:hypothetical protein
VIRMLGAGQMPGVQARAPAPPPVDEAESMIVLKLAH